MTDRELKDIAEINRHAEITAAERVAYVLPRLTCLRCGYTWHPRGAQPPHCCPNDTCHSPYYNRPRRVKAQ